MILGTAVRIADTVAVTGGGAASSSTIAITDKDAIEALSAAAMTSEGSGVWSYVWQSGSGNTIGEYVAELAVTAGAYTAVTRVTFVLED